MAEARAKLEEGLAALRQQKTAVTSKTGETVPSHLLWDEGSAIMSTGKKSKKSRSKHQKGSGWGLTFVAEADSTPEERGVTTVTLSNLPGYTPTQQQQQLPPPPPPPPAAALLGPPTGPQEDVAMEEVGQGESEDEPPRMPGSSAAVRHNRRIVDEDEE